MTEPIEANGSKHRIDRDNSEPIPVGGEGRQKAKSKSRAARYLRVVTRRPRSSTPKPQSEKTASDAALNPPEHLSEGVRSWWLSVIKTYALEPHHIRLLQLAGEAWDRAQQARVIIDKEGITFRDDRKNYRTHPAVGIEKDARIGFARLIRELDLDVEPPSSSRTGPPSLRSIRR